MKDVHGEAIFDFYKGDHDVVLTTYNSYGDPEEMPVEVFFRDHQDFTELENLAITCCEGKILDVGAGAGAHALFMQAFEMDATALENSPGCIETLRHSGMEKIVEEDFFAHTSQYDTLLFLMNGLGLAGKLDNLPYFFKHCGQLLNPGGQIIIDSSDISYLYEDDLPKPDHYFGEIRYQYEYKGKKGDWFDWLYVDQAHLIKETKALGLQTEILMTDEFDQYLAKITGF
ncbi:methyltransferase [Reichenbachiella carrageenanivorans]|uniref:Methyltransferase n=1 Tax=Reichenbachiella carrageenanivorans TaxID=2979869 RepID=A0ABY6CZZ1_9BACT|nr:methyltransferase [Reichenbachiella carrageenanivorans]UXX79452.1 methyltransferase [Reichenbachiella carrageenanivorans]